MRRRTPRKRLGTVPRNQGEELGITLKDLASIPEIVGVKFMTYVDSDKPEALPAIVQEVAVQAKAAHDANLLFFPEDLPAKTMNGVKILDPKKDPMTRDQVRKQAVWSSRNPILFAKALRDAKLILIATSTRRPLYLICIRRICAGAGRAGQCPTRKWTPS